MSVRQIQCLIGILAFSFASCETGCTDAARAETRELRGTVSVNQGAKEDCGSPPHEAAATKGTAADKDGKKDKKDGKKKDNTLDNTGSISNEDIKNVEEGVKKHVGAVYNWPLAARLAVVSVILALPLLTISGLVYVTPTDQIADSVAIRTALHCGFSFTIGWLNCIMLLRYRVFATMMVGNTILMGVAFICNGGLWVTAQEEEATWEYGWYAKKARVLCPAQFENASNYMIMIILFLFGAFIQGLLYKKYRWSSRPFAPIIAAGIITVEMLEYFRVIRDGWTDVYLLSPIYGMVVSISAHCGVGSVPWSATGHMTSMAFKFASYFSDWQKPDLQTAIVNMCLWFSFMLGIMLGTVFHSNRTVMLNALYLQGILIINGVIYHSAEQRQALNPGDATNGVKPDLPRVLDENAMRKSYSTCKM